MVAIAHRLHTAHDADRIAVMDAGRITTVGTHHSLLAENGPDTRMWNSWSGKDPSKPSE